MEMLSESPVASGFPAEQCDEDTESTVQRCTTDCLCSSQLFQVNEMLFHRPPPQLRSPISPTRTVNSKHLKRLHTLFDPDEVFPFNTIMVAACSKIEDGIDLAHGRGQMFHICGHRADREMLTYMQSLV